MTGRFHLFEAFGIELEYMLVDGESLNVQPGVDELFKSVSGDYVSDYEDGPVSWSNELVSHVVEVKVTDPVASLDGVAADLEHSIGRINAIASGRGWRLLPTAMHPWMNPASETRLWPHEYSEIYARYHEVFDCYRHGWANLQSVHLNLPFAGDEEFARLHAAVRLVLPLIPALAASSPVMEGRVTGLLDNRIDVYCANSAKIPEIAGDIIPEPVFSEAEYRERIFEPMFSAIAPLDRDGTLCGEFLNSRGAIARFDRGAVEIRLIDVQECPLADLAVVQAVIHAVRMLVEEKHGLLNAQKAWPTRALRDLLNATAVRGEDAVVNDPDYAVLWGCERDGAVSAGHIWQTIIDDMPTFAPGTEAVLALYRKNGCLARRMLRELNGRSSREDLAALYRKLADGLAANRPLS